VEKTRHDVPARGAHADAVWEIDEFTGDNAGLVVAEIELASADATFERPHWLGRELTDDRRYYNHALALHPYASWTDDERG
ncbi:MAG TPA: CYTH domain protein, partial [Solimonas sp.]|nr:CYTH domain protein [Solimonas sp.]